VTDQDIARYDRERKAYLVEPANYRASRIVVDSMEEARKARRQILAGRDFADVAAEVSKDQHSAEGGGDLGWLADGMVAVYDSALAGLSPGQISEPFKTYEGVEILRLEERRAPVQLTLEESVPRIRRYITNSQANELLAEWVAGKYAEVGFVIDEGLLGEVELPLPEYLQRRYTPEEEDEVEEEVQPLPKIS
jgi:parvulin-like peptidyl-prolyl isomerase